MPLEPASVLQKRLDRGRTRPLRAVVAPRLRVADVALFHGERSCAVRTYIDAKAARARASGAGEHHLIVCPPARAS